MIAVCPNCDARYEIRESQIGKNTTCNKCGTRFRIAAYRSNARPSRATPRVSDAGEASRMTTRAKPEKFRVWFRLGETDQTACARAVRAWADAQKAEGIQILFDPESTTEFEVERNVMPGIDEASFFSGLKYVLEVQGDDPDLLFYHADVAIYPCYIDQVKK